MSEINDIKSLGMNVCNGSCLKSSITYIFFIADDIEIDKYKSNRNHFLKFWEYIEINIKFCENIRIDTMLTVQLPHKNK